MKFLKSKGFSVALIVVGILLLLFSVFQLRLSRSGENVPEDDAAAQWELEPEQTPVQAEESDVDYIAIPGFESAVISAQEETAEIYLYNPESNDCYFVISIWLDDGEEGEEIYESKLISPGQELFEITLSRPLESGTYSAYVHYDTYSTDGSYTPRNGANVPFTLIAE